MSSDDCRITARRPAAGFTLIELVVVMALMVLLFGISYPLLEHWTEGALRKAGRQVTATIERLYERAVVTRQIYRLRFDIGKQQYQPEVLQMVDGAMTFVPLSNVASLLPDGVQFLDLVTAQGTKISDGEAAVYFYPIGRMDAVIIHLEQRNGLQAGEELSLTPHPLTGRVAVSTGDFEFASADTFPTVGIGGMGAVQTTVTSQPASGRSMGGKR
jgi:prepilin-type N-terminal cleavage/methylation domain-containing protein